MLYDCAVIGSGLIGSVAALTLARAGHRVALIDKTSPQQRGSATADSRGIALAKGSQTLLTKIGLGPAFQTFGTPIYDIRVSHRHRRGFIHYGQRETGGIPMGHIVEAYRLKQVFIEAVEKAPGIDCFMPCTPTRLQEQEDRVVLSFQEDDKPDINARFCLAADGRFSWVREHLGIASKKWDYHQTALVFIVRHDKPHHNVAFEHFLSRGPLALLPLEGNRSSVVWTESSQAAQRMLALEPQLFSDEVSRLFGPALGSLTLDSHRWVYPLSGQLALKAGKGRCLLMGDAAHGLHPVAGQGFNLGLRDVGWLEENVKALHDPDKTLAILRQFSRQRAPDVLSMTGATHGLVKLFSNDLEAVGRLRSLGLFLTNAFPPLKKRLTRHAMGIYLTPPKNMKLF